MPATPLLLLTGLPGTGKSTVCLRLAARIAEQGGLAAGLVTLTAGPHRYAWDLVGKERRLLAAEDEELAGPTWGKFHFSADALVWGNDVIARAVALDYSLVILDEVGPIELVRHTGFLPALQTLLGANQASLIVVRPSLVEQLRALADERPIQAFDLTWHNRDKLPAEIAAWVHEQGRQ